MPGTHLPKWMNEVGRLALRSSCSAALALLLGVQLVGCRNVEVEDAAGGAAASQNGAGATKPTSSGAGSSKPSSTTGVTGDACDAFCASVGDCYADCQSTCTSFQDPPCAAQGAALVACMTAHYDDVACLLDQEACSDALGAVFSCRSGPPLDCGPSTCGGGDSACSCTAQCAGGERKLVCNFAGGASDCACYTNGIPWQLCGGNADTNPSQSCDFDTNGCCSF